MFWKTLALTFLVVGTLAEIQISDVQKDQFMGMLQQYCKKNGGDDKAADGEKAITDFMACIKTLFDPETIKKEIEEAKPNGALDEVFKKYCAKTPELKTCIRTMTTTITPCLEPAHREHMGYVINATDQVLDFVCYKDGDRIALFIAEGGPECFQEKANQIRECATKMRESVPDLDSAKKLPIDEQCSKFDELSQCIVKALEACSTPTPANMAESLFKYIRNTSPCKKN